MADVVFGAGHPLFGMEQPIEGLREAGREFHRRSWSLGTSSNYSVVVGRNPLRLLVTASGKHKEKLDYADFVLIDEEGKPALPNQQKSSAETLLHVAVAKRFPKVGSILHTHSVWGTVLSDYFYSQGGFEISGYEMLKGLSGIQTHESSIWVPIFDNTQDIPQLAEQVTKRFDDPSRPLVHGYLIHKHGLYTWGADLDEARRQIEIYEFLFECVVRRMQLASMFSGPKI